VTYLLDVNVLVALFDSAHVHHEAAHRWFKAVGQASWATCPLTENGFVRITSNPAYKSVATTPQDAADRLRNFCTQSGYVRWQDSVSLTDLTLFDLAKLRGHQQIADLYLAGLAQAHGGRLATFDTAIPIDAVGGARTDLVELIPTVQP
jgi:toxin-antitoxin system PIN domain toxin